jgi:hypothetical protein
LAGKPVSAEKLSVNNDFWQGDLPDKWALRIPVKPRWEKYFALSEVKISAMINAVPHPLRGALRDRHKCWARDAMDALVSPDVRY